MGVYETCSGTASVTLTVGSSNLSLPRRLVVRRELQVTPGAPPSEDSRAHSTVGFSSEFGEVFVDSLSNTVLSGSLFRHPDSSGTPPTPSGRSVAISGPGDLSSLSLPRQDLAGVPRSPSQFHGFDSSVQVVYAPSSTSLPEVLFSAQGQSFPTGSSLPSGQKSLSYLGFTGVSSSGQVFLPPPPRLSMSKDASNLGWGAFLHPYHVSGLWSPQEARLHINLLELLAVFLALQSFEDLIFEQSIMIRSDNSMVVSYINHQGGTHSPSLCNLTVVLWDWCREGGIHLLASHVPGEDNLLADFLSRGKFLPSEWTLNHSVFQRICLSFPTPEIDLFARPSPSSSPSIARGFRTFKRGL